ncbi:MAG: DUF2752 domain-containing protein [Polyangiaceae bacterium]
MKRLLLPAALMALAGSLVFVTSLPPLCPMRILLGVPCPSCGLTRATRLAISGDFAGATHLHPLWFVVLPFVAAIACVQIARYVRTGETTAFEGNVLVTRAAKVLLALLAVVWIARFFGAFGGPCPV